MLSTRAIGKNSKRFRFVIFISFSHFIFSEKRLKKLLSESMSLLFFCVVVVFIFFYLWIEVAIRLKLLEMAYIFLYKTIIGTENK